LVPLNENLLGDSINFEDGSLSIYHTDVSLPGNSKLHVAFTRRYASDGTDHFNGILGGWNIDVPFVTYRLRTSYVGQYLTPCTGAMMAPATGASDMAERDQYWAGVTMFVPGGGARLLQENVALLPGATTLFGGTPPNKTNLDHAKVTCLATVQNGAGEGFLATTTDGTQYRFDFKHSFPAGDLNYFTAQCLSADLRDCDPSTVINPNNSKPMTRVNLYASRVTDVNGNTVDYTYSPTTGRLTRIESNDGRVITIGYGVDGRISSVTANGRLWTYSYAQSSIPNTGIEYLDELRRVTLPDGRFWEFLMPTMSPNGREIPCWMNAVQPETGTVKHPDGTLGTFVLAMTMNGKNAVPNLPKAQPPGQGPDLHGCNDFEIPRYTVSRAVTSKTLAVPGAASYVWSFNYHPDLGFYTNLAANDLKQRTLTDPNQNQTRLFYNRRYLAQLEGQLIRSERVDAQASLEPAPKRVV
jgi:hypothetical protein